MCVFLDSSQSYFRPLSSTIEAQQVSRRGAENTQNTIIVCFVFLVCFVYLVIAFPIIETICCKRHQTAGNKGMEEGNWWKLGISQDAILSLS